MSRIRKQSRTSLLVPDFSPIGFVRENPKGFSPLLYPLITWYRADDVIITSGAVSQWNDRSGNGYHALQATPANRPVQVMGALGERPVLNFDGTNDFMYADFGESFAQPNTIFAVWNVTQNIGASQALCDGTSATGRRYIRFAANNTIGFSGGAGGSPATLTYSKTAPFDHIMSSVVFNSNQSRIHENGQLKISGNADNATFNDLYIGKGGFGNLAFLNGNIAEIIAIDGLLSTADHNLFLEYFTNRYGIAHTPIV